MNLLSSMNTMTATLLTSCVVTMAALIGCTDSTTSPSTPVNDNGFGVNASVVVSEVISESEASEVRANVERNADDTIAVQTREVMEIVLRIFVDGEVLGLHLDYDRDELNYECIVRSGDKVYLVVVDPKTGTVKEQKEVEEYYYTGTVTINVTVVPVRQACDRAQRIVDGDVVEANLEEVEGRPTYIIVIITKENRYVTIYVDAETGKEKKLKDEKCQKNKKSDDDDDDDKDDKYDDDDDDDKDDDTGDEVHKGDCDKHKNKRGRGHYRHGKGKGYGHYYHCHCECTCDDDDDGGQNSDSLRVISKDSARIILKGMFGEQAEAGEIKLEVKDSTQAFYETVVESGNDRYQVTLDAQTGGLVQVTQTRGDFENGEYEPPMVDGTSLVSLSTARAAALVELTGTIQSWTLERNKTEGRWVYTFKVEDSITATVKGVRVDAETGLFIEIVA